MNTLQRNSIVNKDDHSQWRWSRVLRFALLGIGAMAIVGSAGFVVWLVQLPSTVAVEAEVPPQAETKALLDSLRSARSQRPTIAVIGLNDATETTDYLYPTGVLRRADIADVVMVGTEPGPVTLYPALRVQPDQTIAEFDEQLPEGADYVIVPAMSRDDDPAVLTWLQQQSAKGAIIIGVCAGAKVVAAAGLLNGKSATTHWYYLGELLRRHPNVDYVPDRRMVMDGRVATTTGISASMPMMLTLIEAIGGKAKASAVASELGIEHWDARHASGNFKFTRDFATGVMGNVLAFWNREDLGVALYPGMDELSLSMVADAWSRTYRSRAISFAEMAAVETANGIRVLPDRYAEDWPDDRVVSVFDGDKPAVALEKVLQAITERYGEGTGNVVAMQLEYPRSDAEP